MANFPPLKNCIFYYLNQMIKRYNIQGPFLDVGCGKGDVSRFLAKKGWGGKAIDFSEGAIEDARAQLYGIESVSVAHQSVMEESGKYASVFMLDVLEHIEEDEPVLAKIHSVLRDQGLLILTLPSNPPEWRWDDEFYGHFRRYTKPEIKSKLLKASFRTICIWDFTFPFFWVMRRAYTFLKKAPAAQNDTPIERTKKSTRQDAWSFPLLGVFLSKYFPIWPLIYWMQFYIFRRHVNQGHEMMVLAQKCQIQ